jgi:hypothetical protein
VTVHRSFDSPYLTGIDLFYRKEIYQMCTHDVCCGQGMEKIPLLQWGLYWAIHATKRSFFFPLPFLFCSFFIHVDCGALYNRMVKHQGPNIVVSRPTVLFVELNIITSTHFALILWVAPLYIQVTVDLNRFCIKR